MVKFFIKALPWGIAICIFWLLLTQLRLNQPPSELQVEEENPMSFFQEIEKIGKLELVRFKFKDVLKFKKGSGYLLIPDQEVLMVVSGEAVGCIDLMKLDSAAVQTLGDTLLVTLPPPELCYAKLNLDSTQVYDLSYSKLFDKTALLQEAYQTAETKVETMAKASGLMEQTRENAVLVLQPLFKQLSKKGTVILRFGPTVEQMKIAPQ